MPLVSEMHGKAALVTGAASGLGRATALALAGAGARLLIVDRDAAGLEQTATQIADGGGEAVAHVADLTDPARCTGAVAAAIDAFGRLDALCNVAGVIVMAHAHEMAAADWDRTLAVNLSAPFHLIQAAIPHLLAVDGAVVNCASAAAFIGQAYSAAYGASKAGLVNLTKALAMEYAHQPIRFNAVAPGGMMTGMVANFAMPEGVDFSLFARYTGLRGLVEVDDVADMIAFLASPAARGYHGAVITIDKGITAG